MISGVWGARAPAISRVTLARAGFSLMEAMVVVMILAIMATVVVPRLNAMVQRPARQSAILVGDFLTSVAQRDALTSQPLAIEFNGEQNTLALLVPADEPGQWRRDLVIAPIQLGVRSWSKRARMVRSWTRASFASSFAWAGRGR